MRNENTYLVSLSDWHSSQLDVPTSKKWWVGGTMEHEGTIRNMINGMIKMKKEGAKNPETKDLLKRWKGNMLCLAPSMIGGEAVLYANIKETNPPTMHTLGALFH